MLVADIYRYTEFNLIQLTLQKYTQLRDFHGNPPNLAPYVNVLVTVANIANITIQFNQVDATKFSEDLNYSIAYYGVKAVETNGRSLQTLRNVFNNKVVFVQTQSFALDFAYCINRQKQYDKLFVLKILLITADYYVWVLIVFAVFAVSFLTKSKKSQYLNYLVTVSALLSTGTGKSHHRLMQNYTLFVLWMIISMVLASYIHGEFTSLVVMPGPEKKLSGVKELKENNYTLVYQENWIYDLVKGMIPKNLHGEFVEGQITTINYLLGRSIVTRNIEGEDTKLLASGPRFATLVNWQFARNFAWRANNYIMRHPKLAHKRRCYLGNELLFPVNGYWAFAGKNHSRLAKIFQVMLDSGIYWRWVEEHFAILFANGNRKLQGIGALNVSGGKRNQFRTTQLGDNIIHIFVLWAFCLITSFMIYVIELMWMPKRPTSKICVAFAFCSKSC